MRVVVIGAGVGGLGSALALSRQGHDVTVLERDRTPLPHDPDEAFEWDRRGAPQVRHSHAMLARLRNLLRDRYPDVLESLYAAGVTDWPLTERLPRRSTTPAPSRETTSSSCWPAGARPSNGCCAEPCSPPHMSGSSTGWRSRDCSAATER